jgi:hypothetical protein
MHSVYRATSFGSNCGVGYGSLAYSGIAYPPSAYHGLAYGDDENDQSRTGEKIGVGMLALTIFLGSMVVGAYFAQDKRSV